MRCDILQEVRLVCKSFLTRAVDAYRPAPATTDSLLPKRDTPETTHVKQRTTPVEGTKNTKHAICKGQGVRGHEPQVEDTDNMDEAEDTYDSKEDALLERLKQRDTQKQ